MRKHRRWLDDIHVHASRCCRIGLLNVVYAYSIELFMYFVSDMCGSGLQLCLESDIID